MPDNNNAAYWNMATQMAGTAANVASQSNTNKKERAFAEKMMWQNRTWAIEDWQKTNAYNHPSEQMARLRMAGLNPNLIYGNSGGAMPSAPIRSTESAKWNPKAPDFSGVGSAVMSFYDTQIKDATIQNLKSQNRLIEEQANKTKIEAEAIQPRVDNLRAGTKLLTTNNKLAEIAALVRSGTMGADIDYAKQRLIKLVADTEYTKNQDIRAAVQNAQSIRESVERVLSSRFHRLQLGEAQIKKLEQRCETWIWMHKQKK